MKNRAVLFIGSAITLLLLIIPASVHASAHASAQDNVPLPALDNLESGWNTIETGGETLCARETPYQFFVRKTDHPENVMLYFQGGGACWNQLSCRENGGLFDDSVGDLMSEIGGYDGIFNFDNVSNPLVDYNIVFVPYCTGDIHIGNAEVAYNDTLVIQHRGQINSRTVLSWMYENYPSAENVLVIGTSAGGYGAIYYAPEVAQAYPEARIVHMSDAAVGVSPVNWSVWDIWNILENSSFDMSAVEARTGNTFFTLAAKAFPNVLFSQFTTVEDRTQVMFYNVSQFGGPDWQDVMYEYIDSLNTGFENFVSYLAPGDVHVILPRAEFYTLTVGDVPFIDWFSAMVRGEPVETVVCDPCVVME